MSPQTGFMFDTSYLFPHFPMTSAPAGKVVVRVHAPFSPMSLRNSSIGKELIREDDWYDSLPWANEMVPAGAYPLLLPIPGSNSKTFAEQKALLLEGEEPAPLVVAMLAMIYLKKAGQPDPLNHSWVRCRETDAAGNCVVLTHLHVGRLHVFNFLDDTRSDLVWLASAQKIS